MHCIFAAVAPAVSEVQRLPGEVSPTRLEPVLRDKEFQVWGQTLNLKPSLSVL